MQTDIKLLSLKLKNFKGIRDLTVDVNGKNANIYGENATGKTSIFDGFYYLLFDKDSAGQKDFAIKTLDANNNPLPGIDHEVEGVFSINGSILSLRKVYAEVWQKKRGSADPVFTGHSCEHFVNGVPVQKKEYDAKIAEIINEDLFKLLTNPTFFNDDKLFPWQKRRAILMEIGGDKLSTEDIIVSNPKLSELTKILKGLHPDEYKKIIAARKSEVNKEIEKIPVRIDEANRSIPDMPEQPKDQIEAEIARLTAELYYQNQKLTDLKSGGLISAKRKELLEIEAEISKKQTEQQLKIDQARMAVHAKKNEYRQKIWDLNGEICAVQRMIDNLKKEQASKQKARDEKRAKWHEVNARTFEFTQDEVCPACGQALPAERLQAARNTALEKFNLSKAEELEKITAEGLRLKTEMEENEKWIVEEEAKIRELTEQMAMLEQECDAIAEPREPKADPELETLILKKQNLSVEIAHLEMESAGTMEQLTGTITELNAQIQKLNAELLKFDQKIQTENRIAELKKQERELAKEYERLERETFLVEEFIRTKVNLLTSKINSRFKYARFKLFNRLINGGIEECCETIYNGVPYSGGLNNAARIVVGLDIISTISQHYKITAPIFIDNCEAITKLPRVESQMICLFVSEKDKKLRIECEGDGFGTTTKIAG